MVVNGAGLLGGVTGTPPQIVAITRRNYSSNLFVDPVDYRWMRTPSAEPSVIVYVNGIQSACNSDCHYDFITVLPVVTGVNLTDAVLSVNITDPESAISNLTKLTVSLDGQTC